MPVWKIISILLVVTIFLNCKPTSKPIASEPEKQYPPEAIMDEKDADFLYKKKDYQGALFLYNKLIAEYPDSSEYVYKRGNTYVSLERFSDAMKDFNKAIFLSGTRSKYYLARASIYLKEKEFEPAVEDLNKAVQFDSSCHACYNSLGIAYGSLYETEEAICAFKNAFTLMPRNNNYRKNLALEFVRQSKTDSALQVLNEGIARDSSDVELYFYRAIVCNEQGDKLTAVKDLEKCLKTSEYYKDLCVDQANYYILKNNLSAAGFLLEIAEEFYKDDLDVLAKMAHLKEYQNNNPEAITYYSKALEISPDHDEWLISLSRLLVIEKRYPECIETFSALLSKYPERTEYLLKRGYAYYKTNRADLAKKDWQKAQDMGDKGAEEYLNLYFP